MTEEDRAALCDLTTEMAKLVEELRKIRIILSAVSGAQGTLARMGTWTAS